MSSLSGVLSILFLVENFALKSDGETPKLPHGGVIQRDIVKNENKKTQHLL